jgi:polysaccharide biosynthesis protein PelG
MGMAGIALTLDRMAASGSLYKTAAAYLFASFVVSGPWILTVVAVAAVGFIACDTQCLPLQVFRSVIIYNSLFSLIVTAPIAFVCTRLVSDDLYEGRTDRINFAFFCALTAFAIISALTAAPFYILLSTLRPLEKLMSLQNLGLLGAAWLLIPFLGVLRSYRTVLAGFAGGTILIVFVATRTQATPFALLAGFNAGLCLVDLLMICRIAQDFGLRITPDFRGVSDAFGRYWDLLVIGIAFGLGLWIDKLIIWLAAPSGVLHIAGVLLTAPSYDTPVFWAQLATLPAIAVFYIHVETRLFRLSRHFNRRVRDHAALPELEDIIAKLSRFASSSLIRLLTISIAISALGILGSYIVMDRVGLRANQMGVLRSALIGSAFQSCATFCFIFLLYLDLRRPALIVSISFLFLNGALTWALLPYGFFYFGLGYMLASIITFSVAFLLLRHEIRWLHFHTFVTNNRSLS